MKCILLTVLSAIALLQNPVSLVDAVMYLTGADDVSEISQEDFEQYGRLSESPLRINRQTRSGLLSSGLFSSYQAASILDYRSRCGDILSAAELSSVDGFNRMAVSYMSLFIDFSPAAATGAGGKSGKVFSGQACAGGGVKVADGEGAGQWFGKMEASAAPSGGSRGIWDFSIAGKSPWSRPLSLPEEAGWSVSYSGTRHLSRVVAGCYNARFGQGLCVWNGMQINSLSTASALMKRPVGIKPYTSYSPSYARFGAAAQMDFGHISAAVFGDLGPMADMVSNASAGANIAWNHANGEIGISAVVPFNSPGRCSIGLDFQHTVKATVLYGEIAKQDSTLAFISGIKAENGSMEYGARLSCTAHEKNVTGALSWLSSSRVHSISSAASLSHFTSAKGETPKGGMQVKTVNTYKAAAACGLTATTRITARWRNWGAVRKYDLRQDLRWERGPVAATARFNAAYCTALSALSYVESGYKSPSWKHRLNVFVQAGVFIADNWDDRLYVYQRDAPQNFNVCAMYGRGWWASLYSEYAMERRLKLYLRANWTAYPWARENDTHRRPSLSARMQAIWSF